MEFSCKAFKMGKCEGQKVVDGEAMPLVLTPAEPSRSDMDSFLSALKENKEWFEKMIIKNSAVLIRGFDVTNAEDFNEIIETFGWEDIRYVGPAPRTHVHKHEYGRRTRDPSPSSYSTTMKWFCDDVLRMEQITGLFAGQSREPKYGIKKCPNKVILFCEVPPPEGGETPFVPSFPVTERMLEELPEAVKEIEEKGLKYTFTALSRNDTSSMLGRGWEDAFGSSDRAEAEKAAKALGMDMEWQPDGSVKTILGPRPLTRVFDGRKGRRMWFNTLVGMYGKQHSSAMMADGTEIPKNIVKRCEEIVEEESIQFKWEKGDVVFLDNLELLHGRRPSLPPRRVLVSTCL